MYLSPAAHVILWYGMWWLAWQGMGVSWGTVEGGTENEKMAREAAGVWTIKNDFSCLVFSEFKNKLAEYIIYLDHRSLGRIVGKA